MAQGNELELILTEGLSLGVICIDRDCRINLWNPWMERHSGVKADEILGQNLFERYPDIAERGQDRYLIDCIENGRPVLLSPAFHRYLIPLDIVREGRSIRMYQNVRIFPVREEDGSGKACVVIDDLTESILYEQEISGLNRVLRGIRNVNHLITRVQTEDALFDGTCRVLKADTGYAFVWIGLIEAGASDLRPAFSAGIGAEAFDELKAGWDDAGDSRTPVDRAVRTGEIQVVYRAQGDAPLCPLGEFAREMGCRSYCCAPMVSDGRVLGVLSMYSREADLFRGEELELIEEVAGDIAIGAQDIRDRRARQAAEAALAEQREWLRVTLSSIGDAVLATDEMGAITFMNPTAEALTGWTERDALGRNADEVFRVINERTRLPVESPVERVLREGTVAGLANHSVLIDRNGEETPIDDSGAPIRSEDGTLFGVVLVFQDITVRKVQERELVRLERLRALGEMSAGVSHNLNNILTSVLGPAQLMRRATKDPDILRDTEEIIAATVRARDLVHQLALSTRGIEEESPEPVGVNQVVREGVQATRPRWKDGPEAAGIVIEVATDLGEVPPARCTGSRLHDILMNLILNAVDAMPEGGRIAIRTQAADDGVRITVGDTGTGMDEETRRRVFEPFFTTKLDVGSGLGLSTVYNAVSRWGGRIDVESVLGEGTTFTLWLPAWTGPEQAEKEAVAVRQVRRGRVLIVEDDKGVCNFLSRLLGDNHEVEVVADGRAAAAGFSPGRYDVALIDIGIPGMPGDLVAREMRRVDPLVALVLITGWELREDDPRLSLFDFRVQKPFDDIDVLEDVVARAVELHDERVSESGRDSDR